MPTIYPVSVRPQRYIGKCEPCKRPVSCDLNSPAYIVPSKGMACPDCGNFCKLEIVYGVTNNMACDVRCEGATGPSCSCSCGGENHGGKWSEKIDNVPAQIIEHYRKTQQRQEQQRIKREKVYWQRRKDEFINWLGDHLDAITLMMYEGDRYFLNSLARQLRDMDVLTDNQISSGLSALREEKERQVKKNRASTSEYQGSKGDKIIRVLTITKIVHLEDKFAPSRSGDDIPTRPMYIFTDDHDNAYVWYASKYQVNYRKDGTFSGADVWKEGDAYNLEFTVKDHKEYNGTKQTIIYYVRKP